jgi:hypothetical protein
MATRAGHSSRLTDRVDLGESAGKWYAGALFLGIVGSAAALGLSWIGEHSLRRFYFAWLAAWAFCFSIAVGALFFVLIQHVTKAGWSVVVRRIAEAIASAMPMVLVLALPALVSVAMNRGELYRWAQPVPADAHHSPGHAAPTGASSHSGAAGSHEGPQEPVAISAGSSDRWAQPLVHPSANGVQPPDELTLKKRAWLNPGFFLVRIALYFTILSAIALWFWRKSVEQDRTGDVDLTTRMQLRAAPCLVLFALCVTFCAFDMLMSLDPHWYSTMFGVYIFAGGVVAFFSTLILITSSLQRGGYLQGTVTTEHYHDMGKWLFGFVFFFGYVAFSQYMLLWYASLPETVTWLARRGATIVPSDISGWTVLALLILFGKVLIPFAGLLSRHVKRNRSTLGFWAAWLLVFHFIDMVWVVLPERDGRFVFGPVEIAALVGVVGFFSATVVRLLSSHPIRPIADPRLPDSVAFTNI